MRQNSRVTTSTLALINGLLLVAGGLGAIFFTRWIGRNGDTRVTLIAAVAAWTILFGLIPFVAFWFVIREIGTNGSLSLSASLIFNLLPFALLLAPVFGFAQGLAVVRKMR